MTISGAISAPLQTLGALATTYGWGPLLGVSRATILSLLSRIQIGQLVIVDVDGSRKVYGQQHVVQEQEKTIYSVPEVVLTIHKDIFWARMLLFADMVCCTAYKMVRDDRTASDLATGLC